MDTDDDVVLSRLCKRDRELEHTKTPHHEDNIREGSVKCHVLVGEQREEISYVTSFADHNQQQVGQFVT